MVAITLRLDRRPDKVKNARITQALLDERAAWSLQLGYSKQKWVYFCEMLLVRGYEMHLYEARRTVSKYITVSLGGRSFKVRFSDHKPINAREANGDCDFFVGRTNTGVSNTEDALQAVHHFFHGAK